MKRELQSFEELKSGLDKYLVGLDYQKEQVIAVYLKHYGENRDFKSGDRRVVPLLVGSSGSGKTAMIQALAKITDRPFLSISAPNITAEGYKGTNLSEYLGDFYKKVNGINNNFESSIIFIDEFDKIITNIYASSGSSITDQQGYLNLLDSNSMVIQVDKSPVTVNTSGMLIFLAGAFSGMLNKTNTNIQSFGFIKEEKKNNNQEQVVKLVKGLRKFGFMDEIIGRISLCITFPDPSKDLVLEVMNQDNNPINKWRRYLNVKHNVAMSVTRDAREYIASLVYKMPFGARGINHFVQPLMNEALIQVVNDETIRKVRMKYDEEQGLYLEYEKGKKRQQNDTYKRSRFAKMSCPDHVKGIAKIYCGYENAREEIERLTLEYTDRVSRVRSKMTYKDFKQIECLFRSILLYLSTEVRTDEINEESLYKLLDSAIKIEADIFTTYRAMLKRLSNPYNEYLEEMRANYEEYLSFPSNLCNKDIRDIIITSMIETNLQEEVSE